MAQIKPFRGIRYGAALMQQMADIITPPYDVIDEDQRRRLLEQNPYNYSRIILPEGEGDARYIAAANLLNQWKRDGVLVRDRFPALYVYKISYPWAGRESSILGFFALLKLERFGDGRVFPHEHTTPAPSEDRLKILERCRANLEPIYILYPDPRSELDRIIEEAVFQAPRIKFRTADGLGHQVWPYQDARALERITGFVDQHHVYIADGHHRYNASLGYMDRLEEQFGPLDKSDPAKYILAFFVNMYHPGFRILSVNRLVKLGAPLDAGQWLEAAAGKFHVRWLAASEFGELGRDSLERILKPGPESPVRFGLLAGADRFAVLDLKPEFVPEPARAASAPVETLDVRILHRELLGRIPGFEAAAEGGKPEGLSFDADPDRSLAAVRDGRADWIFFSNPTRIDQVRAVSNHRDNMPPKSTYFFPKPASGLALNGFDW